MKATILTVALVSALSAAAMTGNDGPFTTMQWTNGLYAQQGSGPVVLFPVPASGQVNIAYPGLAGNAEVMLISEDGRVMQDTEVGETKGMLTTLDLGGLGNGLYFIRVIQPSGLDVTERLVVANN